MKIFVGCSSSNNISKEYLELSRQLLINLIPENELVFGDCNSGIMGIAYTIANENNCPITGVCPGAYKDDFLRLNCSKEITTNTVSERMERFINNSDILLFLPGGIGTIHELYTTIESKKCHEFDKPIIIYNCNGFYDQMLSFMDKVFMEGFSKQSDSNNYYICSNYIEIIEYINEYNDKQICKALIKNK